ncbi:MAG: hypothetical protein ACXWV0_05420 [Flavisolibacter sp.]
MKNQTQTAPVANADVQAKKIIQRIQKWAEKKYPSLESVKRSEMIIECLIEVAEERKYMAARK